MTKEVIYRFSKENFNKNASRKVKKEWCIAEEQCACWSKYGRSLNSGIKCSNCGREL